MGKRIAWFDMVSPKERKRQEEAYNQKIFPFGMQQKELELKLLKSLLPDKKPEDSLYQIVLLKEIFLSTNQQQGDKTFEDYILNENIMEDLQEWNKNKLLKKYAELEQDLLERFAWKCIHISKLNDFPEDTNVLEWMDRR